MTLARWPNVDTASFPAWNWSNAVKGGNDIVDNILLNLINQSGTTVLNVRNNGALYGTAATFSGEIDTNAGLDWALGQSIKGRLGWGSGYVYVGTNTSGGILKLVSGGGSTALTLDASLNATFSSNVTITGNLTVNGTATTIDTTNLVVEDPLIVLAKNQSGTPTLDAGLIIERGSYSNAGLIYDESADEFACIFTDEAGSTAGNVTIASYAALRVGSITESSSIAIKENIFDFTSPLEKISKVRPVKYNRKTSKDKKEIGLIAEELAEIFPELVENDKDGKPTSVNYTRAVTVLFDGFKQMYKELKEIKEKIK